MATVSDSAHEWSDPELRAAGSLAGALLIWGFLTWRLALPSAPPDFATLAGTWVLVIVAMIALQSSLATVLAVRRARRPESGEPELDERDLAIDARAARVEGWIGIAGLNLLVGLALAGAARADGLGGPPTTTPADCVYALLTLGFAAHVARQATVLWLYRR